jgi:hypothetical protein
LLLRSSGRRCGGPALSAGWTVLFDGKSLDKFNTIRDANWRINDGAVVADEGTGFLVTKDPYGDFELRAEPAWEKATPGGSPSPEPRARARPRLLGFGVAVAGRCRRV